MKQPLVIITGASSGIGAALAQAFSKAGYPLGLLARSKEKMEQLALPKACCLEVDVTDQASFKKVITQAEAKFGPVDCLINNAGFGNSGKFTELPDEEDEQMIQVNLQGVIHGMKAVLPGMETRKSGTIINISSLADRNARPHLATYAATKAAVKSLSESLRMEHAKNGIRICNVAPAKVKTPLLNQSGLTQDQVMEAADFAKIVLWIYQQPQGICIRDLVVAPTYYEE